MSLTIDKVEYSVFGNKSIVFCEIDFDASYPTGGEELLPGTLGLTQINFVNATGKSGYIFEYDYTNKKLKAMYPSGDGAANHVAAEVGSTDNLSSLTDVKAMIVGY